MSPSLTAALLAASIPTPPPTAPGAPTLSVASVGNGQVSLLWTQPNDGGSSIIQYPVYRSSDGVTFGPIANVVAPTLNYTAGNLSNGQPWYFYVKARNAVGTGTQSNIVSATPQPPSSPVLLGFYDENSGTVSQVLSVATTVGIGSTIKAISFYTSGMSWGTIGSWTVPGTMPAGSTLLLGVNMVADGQNISAVGANIGQYRTLAGHLPNGTIVRLGWEFDIGTGTGGYPHVVPQASYISAWQQIYTAMKAVNSTLKFDFCCNTGTSSTAQLTAFYPGDAYVDYIGGDHYATPGSTTSDFSQFGKNNAGGGGGVIQLAAARNKPVSVGEWGLATSNTKDDPNFINLAAEFILDPTAAAARYKWPAYTVAYHSYFNSPEFNTDLRNYPKAQAAYAAAFGASAVPGAPTLTATGGVSEAALSWTAVSGATSYNVLSSTTSGAETVIDTGITTLSYVDASPVSGTTTYYTVEAVSASGTSAQSNEQAVYIS